jgi:hypothetical protein
MNARAIAEQVVEVMEVMEYRGNELSGRRVRVVAFDCS